MKQYIITTDTTCDLPEDYLNQHKIGLIPIYYNLNGTVYGDDNRLVPKSFYNIMRGGAMPTTMAANPDIVKNTFTRLLDAGFDILHVAFSSALSGSCSVTEAVARELLEERPDAKIIIVDSLCASMGEGLLVHKAAQLKAQGKNIDEVKEWLEANKLKICHMFTVDDLHHLHRGGRVSKTSAIIGSLINVKPVLHVNNEGRLIPLVNVRGRKKAITNLVDQMQERIRDSGIENDIVFISHGDCEEEASLLADMIKERFGIDKFLINYICPTIGAHSGPGTLALFFMGKER